MNFGGITDPPESSVNDAARCRCGSVARVGCGLCLNCLLQRGLSREEPQMDNFDAALAEIDISDGDWRLGNYQILEEIGRGGMGVIYRARQRYSGRIVALKRVLGYHRESRDTLARFRREAEAAASLDHPNILPIYEVGLSEEDLPFFSMKFASGGSLLNARALFRTQPRLAVHLMAKVARGVEAAHSQGIIHRDLKPGNILLDGRGEPLVSDFGLAKWLDTTSDLTRTLTIFGTPGYIAPEQAEGPIGKAGPAVDLYSLGSILFELLSGRPPFLGEHAIAVIRQAAELPAPRLRSIAPALGRDLETICARCLERDPTARYRSAGDLANDLERWLEGRPIIARPVLLPVRLWRWSRRNPILAPTLGLCALLTIAIFARQLQTRRLQDALWSNASASHSIAVLPFLDLDEIRPDTTLAAHTAELLQRGMSTYGASRVAMVGATAHWTGAATQDEVQEASHENKSRAALSGTRRYVDGKVRVSLHLIHENGADVLGNWIVDADGAEPILSLRKVPDLPGSIYKLFEPRNGVSVAEDPVMSNDTARRFFVAGRDLIGRRTIADMDRAIACFEGAISAAPRTARARSYLAMACMGRDALSSSPPSVERALQVAREAITLAPRDAEANRALCFIDEMEGRYAQSLEYGLRAIECGDQSERSFGQIAYAWRMLGHPEKAVLWYRKAKVSGRQPADYDALLGDCFADLGLVEEAQRAYEAAMNFRPDLPEGWMGLCRLKLLNGDIEGARTLCGRQLNAYAGSPAARQMAALVEFFSRNYQQAERFYSTLLREDPDGGGKGGFYGAVDYGAALARLKQESGDKNTGRVLLEQSIQRTQQHLAKAPQNGHLLYCLAAAEALAGETKASLKHLQSSINSGWIDYKSLRLDPRFDQVSGTHEFQKILSELTEHVAMLGRRSPAALAEVKEN